ncbi:LPXTG cell wall anchor domain-containing protein [Halobacillus kuroshimensis]|uniref:LPXTG cell wall anchor domain-containing protein n=1 Tax=Halobacillus kuroshimensis TaxID=302481 RepID=A0ABS3DWN4_9BACI|nr:MULTISPECIES: EYxxD motif small membrane protein [Halobacillus]MBN8235755.1 LPXTG cell wall anchor domain-containing protein [Halobacillus kuroshimensis]
MYFLEYVTDVGFVILTIIGTIAALGAVFLRSRRKKS